MALPVPAPFLPVAAPPDLLQAAFEIALTGFILFRPAYDPAEPATITDLAYVQLNPAAQRMLRLPACPAESFLTLYPNTVETGVFAFYRDTFLAGTAGRYDVNYQHDGLDNFYQLAAQRHGELLVVSFSDTAEQPRTAVEQALRESQAREQQARAEAEAGRQRLHDILTQLPAQVAVNRGPAHVYELVNPRYQQLFPARAVLGRPVREALPELEGQGFYELLDQVYQTGEPFYGHEMPAQVDYTDSGRMEQRYFNVFFKALHDAQGRVDGLLNFAYDVTPQVLARREAEQLNQELEARVFERTQALRHAQAEAVAATQRLLRITESLPSTSFTVDQTGRVLHISGQWYAYTGMAPGTDINAAWPTLIHPDDLPAIGQEFGTALAEGRPWRYEFRLRGADGAYRWFASQGVPEPFEEAEAAGRSREWFGSNLDIDELKQAQQQLEEKDEFLTSILSSIPASVATFEGEDLRFGFFNEAYQRLARGRVVPGRAAVEVFPEVAEQGFLALLRQVLRTGEPHQGQEVPAYARDPHTGQQQDMYLDLAYLPLRHGQHPPHAVLGFIVDVTDRVRARQRAEGLQAELLAATQRQVQERETQRQQLHKLFMEAPAPIVILDGPALVFQLVNPAYQRVFPGRALLGKPLLEALPELAGLPLLDDFRSVYDTGETFVAQELPLQLARHDGGPLEEMFFTFTYQARRNPQDEIDGVLVFAHEVTDQVQARRVVEEGGQQARALAGQLADSNQQLTRTNVDLDNFIYTASHDLKAPISNIEGLLDTLRDELPPQAAGGEVPYILELMQDSVDRFTRTIEHLTDVSRLQKEHDQPHEPVPLAGVIEDVRLDLAPLLQQTGGRLDIDVRAVPTVQFSVKNLRSVVYNLLSNALKYRHPDRAPQVQVRGREEAAYHVLEVQDNGLGLDLTREPELFGMFRRYHTHVDGSGIGLYMVKRMVENTGGRIEVHSTLGEGSTFTVYFPQP